MLHQEIWEKYCSWSLIEEDDIAIKDKVGRLASLLPRNHEKRAYVESVLRAIEKGRVRKDPLEAARSFAKEIFPRTSREFAGKDPDLILRGHILYLTQEYAVHFEPNVYEENIIAALSMHLCRQLYCMEYSWSIPNRSVVDAVALQLHQLSVNHLFDVGGGRGLWSLAFRQSGMSTTCIVSPHADEFSIGEPFIDDALPICASVAAQSMKASDAIFLSWVPPTPGSARAFATLVRNFPGKICLVVSERGKFQQTTSGSREFWETLGTRFPTLEQTWRLGCFPGYTDTLHIYSRK